MLFLLVLYFHAASKLSGDLSGNTKMPSGIFGQNLQKRSKAEPVNITIDFTYWE